MPVANSKRKQVQIRRSPKSFRDAGRIEAVKAALGRAQSGERLQVRERRAVVALLEEEGYTSRQMAESLGVSIRRIDEDRAKIRIERVAAWSPPDHRALLMSLLTGHDHVRQGLKRTSDRISKRLQRKDLKHRERIDLVEAQVKLAHELREGERELMNTLSKVGFLPRNPDRLLGVLVKETGVGGTSLLDQLLADPDKIDYEKVRKLLMLPEHLESPDDYRVVDFDGTGESDVGAGEVGSPTPGDQKGGGDAGP